MHTSQPQPNIGRDLSYAGIWLGLSALVWQVGGTQANLYFSNSIGWMVRLGGLVCLAVGLLLLYSTYRTWRAGYRLLLSRGLLLSLLVFIVPLAMSIVIPPRAFGSDTVRSTGGISIAGVSSGSRPTDRRPSRPSSPTVVAALPAATDTSLPVAPTDTLPAAPTDTPLPAPTDTLLPVPTDTAAPPVPTDTTLSVPTDTAAPPAPTDTPPPPVPTDTAAPTDTPQPKAAAGQPTYTAAPSSTPQPSSTPRPSNTPVPPTNTSVPPPPPTSTPKPPPPTATPKPLPPTSTSVPPPPPSVTPPPTTSTPLPPPTNTAPPTISDSPLIGNSSSLWTPDLFELSVAMESGDSGSRQFRVLGFVYHQYGIPANSFVLTRYVTPHCAAEAHALGILLTSSNADSFADDQWVWVVGTTDRAMLNGKEVPVIKAITIQPASEPADPYIIY